MPTLSEAIKTDLSGYSPVEQTTGSPQVAPSNDLQPGFNSMMRCPLPPIFQAQPDSLRQFYQGGSVPQTRLLSAVTSGINGGGSTGTAVVRTTVVQGGGGGSPSIAAAQAVVTTGVLGPGQAYVGALSSFSRSFQLLNVASSTAARVAIYGTSNAQTNDLYRGVDQAPAAGTAQGIVTDVVLDTLPYQWNFQNRFGANSDVPQQPEAYITITNLSGAAVPITVTLQYVPVET